MNLWMLLVVIVLLVFIATKFRAPRPASDRRPEEMLDHVLSPEVLHSAVPRPPPLPRRRAQPPPLPRGRAMEVLEALPVAKPQQSAEVTMPKPLVAPKRPRSPGAGRLAQMLRDRQSLRTAVLLREVLAPPLCKRRK